MEIIKHYTNGEVTVVWQPSKCIHSTHCFRELPRVFNPRNRPWVTMEGTDTERIIEQIKACPSGALGYVMKGEEQKEPDQEVPVSTQTIVEALPNGPLLVHGSLKVRDRTGIETEKTNVTAFCRCGASQQKPYCDGSHVKNGFEG